MSQEELLQNTEDMTKLLAQVRAEGSSPVHSQWMKGLKGRDFCISNGLIWNVETATGLPPLPVAHQAVTSTPGVRVFLARTKREQMVPFDV